MAKKKTRPEAEHLLGMTPLERTSSLLDISVTERGQFRSCHRRWHLQTIENLEPKAPTWALSFGTGIHAALEAYYTGPIKGRNKRARDAFQDWYVTTEAQLKDDDGTPGELDELYDYCELGHDMLDNYFEYDKRSNVKLGKVLAVEGNFRKGVPASLRNGHPDYPPEAQPFIDEDAGRVLIPIVNPETHEPIDDRIPCLTMKLDILTERDTPRKGLWVVDHKTSSSAYNDRGLDFNDQATGYCYGVYRLSGIVPRGAIFNVLIKERVKEPRVSEKTGALSYAKDQLTTADLYRQALKEHGLMKGNRITSEKHAECLDALLARGWRPFFQRLEPTRNEHELISFERRLAAEYADMAYAHEDPDTLAYPNPSERVCPYCPVAPICQALEDGSDAVHVIETQFRQADDRKAAA